MAARTVRPKIRAASVADDLVVLPAPARVVPATVVLGILDLPRPFPGALPAAPRPPRPVPLPLDQGDDVRPRPAARVVQVQPLPTSVATFCSSDRDRVRSNRRSCDCRRPPLSSSPATSRRWGPGPGPAPRGRPALRRATRPVPAALPAARVWGWSGPFLRRSAVASAASARSSQCDWRHCCG